MRAGLREAAGAMAASLAALCCAGTPLIVAGLATFGLGFLRNDALLIPLMLFGSAVAVAGFWRDGRRRGAWGPLLLGGVGAALLISGVLLVHGVTSRFVIFAGGAGLLIASGWNIAWSDRETAA